MTPTLLVVCVFALTTTAQAAPPADVQALLDGYRNAWARSDGPALAGFYAADGSLSTPYGVDLKGPAQISAFYTAAFARGYAGSRGEAALDIVTLITPDAIFGRGHWSISAARDEKNAERAPECGPFFAALRREHGQWRIVALHELGGRCEADRR